MQGANGAFMTEQESNFHDLVHLLAQMQKLMNEASKLLDKIVKKEPYRFEYEKNDR